MVREFLVKLDDEDEKELNMIEKLVREFNAEEQEVKTTFESFNKDPLDVNYGLFE